MAILLACLRACISVLRLVDMHTKKEIGGEIYDGFLERKDWWVEEMREVRIVCQDIKRTPIS